MTTRTLDNGGLVTIVAWPNSGIVDLNVTSSIRPPGMFNVTATGHVRVSLFHKEIRLLIGDLERALAPPGAEDDSLDGRGQPAYGRVEIRNRVDGNFDLYSYGRDLGGGLGGGSRVTLSPFEVGRLSGELQRKAIVPTTRSAPTNAPPIRMRLVCEACGEIHIDEGEFATKPHHTHQCEHCGLVWRPAQECTVGVLKLWEVS